MTKRSKVSWIGMFVVSFLIFHVLLEAQETGIASLRVDVLIGPLVDVDVAPRCREGARVGLHVAPPTPVPRMVQQLAGDLDVVQLLAGEGRLGIARPSQGPHCPTGSLGHTASTGAATATQGAPSASSSGCCTAIS